MAKKIQIATNKKTGEAYVVESLGPKFAVVQKGIFNVRPASNGGARYKFEKTMKVLMSFLEVNEVEATFGLISSISSGKPASVLAAEAEEREQRSFERKLLTEAFRKAGPDLENAVRRIR